MMKCSAYDSTDSTDSTDSKYKNTFFFQTITLVLKRSSAVKELYKRIMNVCFETRILVIDIFVKELL